MAENEAVSDQFYPYFNFLKCKQFSRQQFIYLKTKQKIHKILVQTGKMQKVNKNE